MTAPTYRTTREGVRLVFRPDNYRAAHPHARIYTCGACGRSWDDAHASGWTPTPSGRCPFEYQHKGSRAP